MRLSRGGKRHTKLFSDGVFGGKAEALHAAKEYRDKMREELGAPSKGRRGCGIRLREKDGIQVVEASHYDDGARYVRSWSLEKWELRRALWKACVWKVGKQAEKKQTTPGPGEVRTLYDELYRRFSRLEQEAVANS